MRYYDLNIKDILKNWKVSDAIRELIANAIDESIISNSKNPDIYKENNNWVIKDYGRGLTIKDFAQNENVEKKDKENIIGRFGIGLKDAIAVLFRNKIQFKIYSKNWIMEPILHLKNGFNQKTIHMKIDDNNYEYKGTKIIFVNINNHDIKEAKDNFLIFNDDKILFSNQYGQIIEKKQNSYIYVNGMKVAMDEKYTMSYNIKKINKKMASKMNRERKSIGREAYSDIVEKIICDENVPDEVLMTYINNRHESGEFVKKKVRETIYNKMNNLSNYVFINQTEFEKMTNSEKEMYHALKKEILIIKDGDSDLLNNLYNLSNLKNEYNSNFVFEFVDENKLSYEEKMNFKIINQILNKMDDRKKIKIVSKNNELNQDILGYWSLKEPNLIFIVKKALANKKMSIITLIHEYAHSINGNADSSREFENDLETVWYKFYKVNESI